jgi:tRNA threonylcarbamoyl adenosine modification protein YeaZ
MEWNVLALDTSTEMAAVGLFRHGEREPRLTGLESLTLKGPGGHSSTLPPEIKALLERHFLKAADLDLVVVGRGPGSFTGLRTGLALAKGLTHGTKALALGLSSLAALAGPENGPLNGPEDDQGPGEQGPDEQGPDEQAPRGGPKGPTLVAPVIDARHGELFTQLYDCRSGPDWPEPLSEILVLSPQALMPALKALDPDGLGIRLKGPGLALLPELLAGFSRGSMGPPDPLNLAKQAFGAYSRNQTDQCPLTPLYGRSPDIFKKWTPPSRLNNPPS